MIASAILIGGAVFSAPGQVAWPTIKEGQARAWTATARYPQFSTDTPLARAVNGWVKNEVTARVQTVGQQATEGGRPSRMHSMTWQSSVTIERPDVISMIHHDTYVPGSGPTTVLFRPRVYGLMGGKPARLGIASVVLPGTTPGDVRRAIVPGLNEAKQRKELPLLDLFDARLLERFVVTPSGLTWIFSPGDVGEASEGEYRVPVSWRNLFGVINPDGPLGKLMLDASPVQLSPRKIRARGGLVFRHDDLFPYGSIAEINLVHKHTGAVVVVFRHTVPAWQGPVPFDVEFDVPQPETPEEGAMALFVEARVVQQNGDETRVLYRSRGAVPVQAPGWSKPIAIPMIRT